MSNCLFTPDQVFRLAAKAFPSQQISLDERSGWDEKEDMAWAMRLWVSDKSCSKVCYLSTFDLTRDEDDLIGHLRDGFFA